MNQLATVVLSVLAASAGSAGVAFSLRPTADGDRALVPSQLQASVQDLEQRNCELQQTIQELAARSTPVAASASLERAAAPTLAPEQVAAAV